MYIGEYLNDDDDDNEKTKQKMEISKNVFSTTGSYNEKHKRNHLHGLGNKLYM